MAVTAAEPPARGDHRHTWLGLLLIAVLFTAAVATAILVVEASNL